MTICSDCWIRGRDGRILNQPDLSLYDDKQSEIQKLVLKCASLSAELLDIQTQLNNLKNKEVDLSTVCNSCVRFEEAENAAWIKCNIEESKFPDIIKHFKAFALLIKTEETPTTICPYYEARSSCPPTK